MYQFIGMKSKKMDLIKAFDRPQSPFYCKDDFILFNSKNSISSDNNGLVILIDGYIENCESKGDTISLIEQCYCKYGDDFVSELDGAFSMVLFDRDKDKLILSVDKIGVKSLYYYQKDDMLLFSNSLDALLNVRGIKHQIDIDGLTELLSISPAKRDSSAVLKAFRALPAASIITQDSTFKIKKYWDIKYRQYNQTLEETFANVNALLSNAVNKHFKDDKLKYGSMLSGGLDSSIISKLASLNTDLKMFSVTYPDHEKDFLSSEFQPESDAAWVEKVKKQIDGDLQYVKIEPDRLAENLLKAVRLRGLPGMADVDSSLLLFADEINKNVDICFSGEGADELFGGYPWFYKENVLNNGRFPWSSDISFRKSFLNKSLQSKINIESFIKSCIDESMKSSPKYFGDDEQENNIRQLFFVNMQYFMKNLLIRCETMGQGLDIRMPFADRELIEYVWNVPWKVKNYNNYEKSLLRGSFKGLLEDDCLWRKKSPYPKTFNPKYTETIQGLLKTELKNSPLNEIIDMDVLKGYIDAPQSITKPWFGQLLTGPQLLAYFLQMHYWLVEYNIDILT